MMMTASSVASKRAPSIARVLGSAAADAGWGWAMRTGRGRTGAGDGSVAAAEAPGMRGTRAAIVSSPRRDDAVATRTLGHRQGDVGGPDELIGGGGLAADRRAARRDAWRSRPRQAS